MIRRREDNAPFVQNAVAVHGLVTRGAWASAAMVVA